MDIKICKEDFVNWYNNLDKKCHYCELPEKYSGIIAESVNRKSHRLTIDRCNNLKPYSISNMVLSCYWCNQIKGKYLTKDEMEIIGKLIIKPKWENHIKNV